MEKIEVREAEDEIVAEAEMTENIEELEKIEARTKETEMLEKKKKIKQY